VTSALATWRPPHGRQASTPKQRRRIQRATSLQFRRLPTRTPEACEPARPLTHQPERPSPALDSAGRESSLNLPALAPSRNASPEVRAPTKARWAPPRKRPRRAGLQHRYGADRYAAAEREKDEKTSHFRAGLRPSLRGRAGNTKPVPGDRTDHSPVHTQ